MIIFLVYIYGMIVLSLYMDSDNSECDHYNFGERLELMLFWPLFAVAYLIIEVVCWLPYRMEICREHREHREHREPKREKS